VKNYLLYFVLLSLLLLFYLQVAKKFQLVDKPNSRSSHTEVTILGGGIIFVFSFFISLFFSSNYITSFILITSIIFGVLGFVDDKVNLSVKSRLIVGLLLFAICLIIVSLNQTDFIYYNWIWLILPVFLFFCFASTNIYNFMDGINGILGLNSLVVLGSIAYFQVYNNNFFIENNILYLVLISIIVFLFFNFRKKAVCFSGDVGSISLGSFISLLIVYLYLKTESINIILFSILFYVDAGSTLLIRMYNKQKLFNAHRLHLYQLFANEKKVDHRIISIFYSIIQLLISLLVIHNYLIFDFYTTIAFILALIFIFLLIRFSIFKNYFFIK
jgi:UDP-N-acetylmuramyl pentapeptide phosphotransferase/UDP-N-acetylglucosamine-1-phosphate transferase